MTSHTDKLRDPNALEAASLSVESAIRGELIGRFLLAECHNPPSKADLARVRNIAQGFHARVVRVDEEKAPCGKPHHGYALLLIVDRQIFAPGMPARGCLEELTEQLLSVHHRSCREAILPMDAMMDATKPLAAHPNLPDAHTLENEAHHCMLFGPTASLPITAEGKEHGRIRSVLFGRTIEDLLSGINTQLKINRQINLKLHEGRAA